MTSKIILLIFAMHSDGDVLKTIEFNSVNGCEKFRQEIRYLHTDYETGELIQNPDKRHPLFYSKCVVVEDD